jgi:hypothetical protein
MLDDTVSKWCDKKAQLQPLLTWDKEGYQARALIWLTWAVLGGAIGFLAAMVFWGKLSGDDPAAMLVAGALIGVISQVIGYWFGSSAGSKRAADRLQEQTARQQEGRDETA